MKGNFKLLMCVFWQDMLEGGKCIVFGSIMKISLNRLFIWLLLCGDTGVYAQDEFRVFAPTKDVALLVDVSVSVKGDRKGHEDAKRIIQDIVLGRGFSKKKLESTWESEANPDMAKLFGAYLGQPVTNETAELRPLLAEGSNFLTLRIGTVSTVLTGGISHKIKGGAPAMDALIEAVYPRTKEMNDKSTCFWLAMARSAETLSQHSKLGYYLFVVSDEEDDPDYRKEGPLGHTAGDYDTYVKDLAKTYPETAIRSEIARYFDFTGVNAKKVETYKARNDFKQVLIARFFQEGARNSNKKVAMSWYAMRVTPEKVLVPRVLLPPPIVINEAPPLEYQPPIFKPALQWLGGLEGSTRKQFNYYAPLLVWQVINAEAGGFEASKKPVVQIDSQTKRGKVVSTRHDSQTWPIPANLDVGDYEVKVRHGSLDSQTQISIRHPTHFWINLLAIVSGVLAVVIFALAWKNLRQTKRTSATI